MIALETAREWLRIDGTDNDLIIQGLIQAADDYVQTVTGLDPTTLDAEPLAQTAIKFLLTLWYNPEQTDAVQLQRVADNLLKTITVKIQEPVTQ